jgi:RNA-directed DNA polymerase
MKSAPTLTFTSSLLEASFLRIKSARKHYPAHADRGHLCFHWHQEKDKILRQLNHRPYLFEPLTVVTKNSGKTCGVWGASDALVLDALTHLLTPHLPVHPLCEPIKGHGDGKQSAS